MRLQRLRRCRNRHRPAGPQQIEHRAVAKHLALAGIGENDEFVAEIAADGPVSARMGIEVSPSRWKVRR
jgi:hypothetical protein